MGFGFTEGHQKRHYSIEHIRIYVCLHGKYASIYYLLRYIPAHWSKIATPLAWFYIVGKFVETFPNSKYSEISWEQL